jgi:hypothetical protein
MKHCCIFAANFNTMKKIIFVCGLLVASAVSFAQSNFSFGLKTGFNASLPQISPTVKGAEMLPTFHVGAFGEYGLNDKLSFQAGLLFNGRGTSIAHEDHHDDLKLYGLDIPLMVMYRTNGLFFGAGPSIGFNIAGNFHSHEEDGTETEQKIKFGSAANEKKPLNYGLNLIAGYELKNGFFAQAGFLYDLTNWSNASGVTEKYHILSFGLGYRFVKK